MQFQGLWRPCTGLGDGGVELEAHQLARPGLSRAAQEQEVHQRSGGPRFSRGAVPGTRPASEPGAGEDKARTAALCISQPCSGVGRGGQVPGRAAR